MTTILRRTPAAPVLLMTLLNFGLTAIASPVAMLTFHNDNTRQGANTNETSLTWANVNQNNFGKLFSYAVDGYVYAQPLVMPGVAIPGKGVHDVVLVATEHNSVYAFDADSNAGTDAGLLWQRRLGTAAPMSPEYGARYHREGNTDLVPEAGITGTPVIDPATGTLFVDVFSREVAGDSVNYYHRIHALDIATGQERAFSPVVVSAAVPGTGADSVNGLVTFNAKQHLQRPALTLAGGILYVAYGSHADTDPYHGWIIGYNPADLQLLTNYVFNTKPNATRAEFGSHAGEGALWMGGNGLVVDARTNLYFEVANGSFSADKNGGDYGDSFIKLNTTAGLLVADYFTPHDQAAMQASDADLGSGGPMLLPDSVGSTAHPHLIVGAGKPGIIHLLDADDMGKYNSTNDSQIVQELTGAIGGGSYATPAYFNHRIYYTGKTDNVKAFDIADGVITPEPSSKSPTALGPFTGSPTVSANGTNDGIAWVIDPGAYNNKGPGVLHAYNAGNLAEELYNSSQNLTRDNPGGAVKMTTPTVANGKVYVGAEYQISVYGAQVFLAAPVISPEGGAFTNQVTVKLAGTSPGADIYYTLDGGLPTTNSLRYTRPFELRDNAKVQAIAIKSGATSSRIASATFVNTSARGHGSGLSGGYYVSQPGANPFTGSPALMRMDAKIDFNLNASLPATALGRDGFAVRWAGSVQPQYSETYTFVTAASGGVRLSVNGRLLIDDWANQSATVAQSNTIALAAQQFYNLELDYHSLTSNAAVQLSWRSPSTPLAVIPQSQLYPFTNPPPTVSLLSPANESGYTASASLTISAKADAPHNLLSQVNFYANHTLLGSATKPPYTITATSLNAGGYLLSAVATDASGLSGTSAPVTIHVKPGSGQPYGLVTRGTVPAFLNLPTTGSGTLPRLLSETGIFSDTPGMTPASGLISYVPNTPLWADGAEQINFFAVPKSAGITTPAEQIGFSPTGNWTFPDGTVFVKTLELNTDSRRPDIKRRLETQVLVRDGNGQIYGGTYKWRADNRDADLLTSSLSENISVTNAAGVSRQTWYYASPADCRLCHTPVASYVLGVNTRQLNRNHTYPATGVTDNQLRTLNHLGLLNPAIDEAAITRYEKLSALTNLQASLEDRARSYLDANCAQCHRPGGFGVFDARYETPLAKQNLINVAAAFNLGLANARIIAPQDTNRSVIYVRMNSLNPSVKMPLVGHNLVDTNAVKMMAAWIDHLPITPEISLPKNPTAKTNLFE